MKGEHRLPPPAPPPSLSLPDDFIYSPCPFVLGADALPIIGVDTHKTPVLGRRKPDLTLYERTNGRTVFAVVGLIQLTKFKAQKAVYEFSESKTAQIVTFRSRLLLLQPLREAATGLLSDGRHIQFIKVERRQIAASVGQSYTAGPVLALDNDNPTANRWLWSFLRATPRELGWSLPAVAVRVSPPASAAVTVVASKREAKKPAAKSSAVDGSSLPVELTGLLGSGASAVVYSGRYQGHTVVVKVFRASAVSAGRVACEIANLRSVRSLRLPPLTAPSAMTTPTSAAQVAPGIAIVPELLATAETDGRPNTALVLSPIGSMFPFLMSDFDGTIQYLACPACL
jgi:hypothetical protein